MSGPPCIAVENLHKSYGDFEAVRGIDLEVKTGEVFGLLGPNGAGKTTTLEILEGIRPRTSGSVSVLGLDPAAQSKKIKDRIGVCLQATNLPDKMEAHEALDLFARLLFKKRRSRSTIKTPAALGEERCVLQNALWWTKTTGSLSPFSGKRPQSAIPDEPTTGSTRKSGWKFTM